MPTFLLRAVRTLLCVLAPLLFASSAHAAPFQLNVAAAAPVDTGAAKFSDVSISVDFPGESTPRDVTIDLPGGQLAVLTAAAECSAANVVADTCPAASLLGSAVVRVTALGLLPISASGSLYRMPATGTEVGRFAVVVRPPIGDRITAYGTLRLRDDGTDGVRAALTGLPRTARIGLLGIPLADLPVTINSMRLTLFGRTSQSGPNGLFFNPSRCVPAQTKVTAVSWAETTASGSAGYTPTGCDRVPFTPKVFFTPESSAPGTPVPFGVNLEQPFNPAGASMFATYAGGRLDLPVGVSLSAAANSDGKLVACTEAQFDVSRATPVQCPAGAQLGTVTVLSPLVPVVSGRVYLAQPAPGQPDDLARLFVVGEQSTAPDALRVKFVARLQVDPSTGRVSALLDSLPNVPVQRFTFQFRGGTSPAARQPAACGTYTGGANVAPLTGAAPVTLSDDYVVDQDCSAPRTPAALELTSDSTQAGAFVPLTTRIAIPSRTAPTNLSLDLPPGLLGQLAGVPMCSLADAAAGTCPAASRVGSIEGLAGQSPLPGSFPGSMFLTPPPSADAVAGLAIAVPATVGPISIGELRVIASLKVRADVGVSVVAELPTSVRGIPLDLSALRLRLDRPNFIRNPSACGTPQAQLSLGAPEGTTTAAGAVTVTGCERLPWTPSMRLTLGPNASDLAANGKPTLDVRVEPGPGGAALRDLSTKLPAPLAIDLTAVNRAVCPNVAAISSGTCTTPAVGSVSITTPVFDTPVRGTVRLARVPGKVLPAAVIVVRDRLSLDLVGLTTVGSDGRIIVDFTGLPDAPITAIDLRLDGGTNGALKLGSSACQAASLGADSTLTAQHGAKASLLAPVARPCSGVLAAQASGPAVAVTLLQLGKRLALTAGVRSTQPVSRFSVTLPTGARLSPRLAAKLRLTVGGKVVRAKRISTTARTLTVFLRTPAVRLRVTTPAGSLSASTGLRRSLRSSGKRAKLRAQFTVHERGGTVRKAASKVAYRSVAKR